MLHTHMITLAVVLSVASSSMVLFDHSRLLSHTIEKRSTSDTPCDVPKLTTCGQNYLTNLGIDEGPASVVALAVDLQEFIDAQPRGAKFTNVCRYRRKFATCMGQENVGACVSETFLEEGMHWEEADALGLVMMEASYDYMCLHLSEINSHYACVTAAKTSQEQPIEKCVADYTKAMESGQALCPSTNSYIGCLTSVAQAKCPSARDLVCNLLKVELQFAAPQCQLKC